MVKEVRDSQKSRHYSAERFLYDTGKTVIKTGSKNFPEIKFNLTKQSSIYDCQSYLNIICEQYWFRQRFGTRQIYIEAGRNGGKAFGSNRITLGTWARNEAIILHELAHCLAPHKAKHGAEFAGIFLFLVKNAFGADIAKQLRESYKTHRVKYNNKAIPPINKSCLTNAQKSALVRKNQRAEQQRKKELSQKPILLEEQEHLIRLLTRAINSGQFGEPRSKTRASAQKVIRDVKKLSEKKASARLVA
jgi:putative metallohydrolase (TIGR04338 family)